MKKRMLAFLISMGMVLTGIAPAMPLAAQAGQTAEESVAATGMVETTPGETSNTDEKQLIQYYDDWLIFRYMGDTGNPMFDVKYQDKTTEELKSDGKVLQYQIIFQNNSELMLGTYSWYSADRLLSEEEISIIEANKTDYFIQFRVVDKDDATTAISKSVRALIWPQEEPFPYVVTSTIDPCEIYDVKSQSVEFKITLVFNDLLYESATDDLCIDAKYDVSSDLLFGETYQKDYSNCIYTNYVTVDGKQYVMDATNISFYVKVPAAHLMDMNYNYTFSCLYTFRNIEGEKTHKAPNGFMLNICVPPLSASAVLAQSINITSTYSILTPGTSLALTANVLPKNTTDKSVTWSSSNPEYAVVDENGVVTAKAAGIGNHVTITATARDGSGVTGNYTFYINPISVKGITINAETDSVDAGSKLALSATVTPRDATVGSVTWSSSNTSYATVNQSGVVTAKAAGAGKTVTITATANDGSGVKATFIINIKKVNVSKLTLTTTNKTVKAGQKASIKATVSPSNATNQALTWTSSNTKYATVNSKGVVTTKKAGVGKTVTITAKAKDGSGKKASIKIKIVKTVPVSSIKLTVSSKTVRAGKKVTVKATIAPSNASNKVLTWTTSNKKYATVSNKGVVTTKKAGKGKTVTITAKAKDGSGKKATIKLKVK